MLNEITPLLLTYNEAPNIARTIERLCWAKHIIVVDSFSTDETPAILSRYPQVSVIKRKFDSHADQWNYALTETNINTEWVLALDADYLLSDDLIEEVKGIHPGDDISGYQASFKYCVNGKRLRGSLYPPVTVLYRKSKAMYRQDGHAQKVSVNGRIEKLRGCIYHDDRKTLSRWVGSQVNYMRLEGEKLSKADKRSLGSADRLRRLRVIAPFAVLFYCLFIKRTILDGKAGIFYSFQRMFAEFLLALFLIEIDLNKRKKKRDADDNGPYHNLE